MLKIILYFIFINITLLIPSYGFIKKSKWLGASNEAVELCGSYSISLILFGLVTLIAYAFKLPISVTHLFGWLYIIIGTILFIQNKYYKNLYRAKNALLGFLILSFMSIMFINLNAIGLNKYIPDPEFKTSSNYNVLNVKVLNLTQTNANDNYIPYRQAQFIVNKLDPGKNSFIDEWGVHFFQRTPLMGGVTAFYFDLYRVKPPIDYLWSNSTSDVNNTYLQFQIIASILNSLLLVSGFYLIKKLFNTKVAFLSTMFLAVSQFFLYNSFYTWPKSLVAFFILFSWYLILEDKFKYTVLAGIVSAAAYFTHDLALMYLVATFLLLLFKKRYRDIFIVFATTFIAALPWVLTSSIIYKKASTFYLYPFSVKDIPQPGKNKEIISQFLKTPVAELIAIRLRSLKYLLTPYSLYESSTKTVDSRFRSVGIFSIAGAIGFGLIIPSIVGVFKKIRLFPFAIILLVPIACVVAIFGWSYPGSIGALHFAQPIVLIAIACGVWWLTTLKNSIWLLVAFLVNVVYTVFFIANSFEFNVGGWVTTSRSTISLFSLAFVLSLASWQVFKLYRLSAQKTKT